MKLRSKPQLVCKGEADKLPAAFDEKIKAGGIDGPRGAWVETASGNCYQYRTYMLTVRSDADSAAQIFLWAAIKRTIKALIREHEDQQLIWRVRPEVKHINADNYSARMRLVFIPAGESV